jgi:hypothetical protein
MKLRCTHNSIRIRIRKSELLELSQNNNITETIAISPSITFSFGLEIANDVSTVHATFIENKIGVLLPVKEAKEWINTNQVGIEVNNVIGDGQNLHILIEKDFPCLDRPEEDKSDTFWELAPDTPETC